MPPYLATPSGFPSSQYYYAQRDEWNSSRCRRAVLLQLGFLFNKFVRSRRMSNIGALAESSDEAARQAADDLPKEK